MSRTYSTDSPEQSHALRQLKALVVVLILSNIGIGALSFHLLRRLDQQYSTLIGRSVQVMNDLQAQTARTVDAMRSTNVTMWTAPDQGRGALVEQARDSVERDRKLREVLLTEEWLEPDNAERREYRRAGEEFSRIAGDVVTSLAEGHMDEANQLREARLRPAFERYMAATGKTADKLLAESVRIKDQLSAKTGSVSTMLLGFASWPVAILCALLVITIGFVVVMMVLFRGRTVNYSP